MRFPGLSITTKLLFLILFVGISAVFIIGTYSFLSARNSLILRTIDQLISVRAVKKQQVEYYFSEKSRNLKILCKNETVRKILSESQVQSAATVLAPGEKRQLQEYFSMYGFTNLYLISSQQEAISFDSGRMSAVPRNLQEYLRQQALKITTDTSVVISDLYFRSETDTVPVCFISGKVTALRGNQAGTILLEIPSTVINRIMLQDNSRIGLGNSGEAYIVGNDNRMRSTSRFITGSILKVPVQSETAMLAHKGLQGAILTTDYRGIRVFSAYEPLSIPGLDWVVLAEIDYSEAMSRITSLKNDIMLVSLIIFMFLLGFAQIISKMVTQPIRKLKNAAQLLGQGNFENKVSIHTGDELELLAGTFNTMSDQLKEERSKRIRALYDGQEMERKRISRELHDGLGQRIVGAKLLIENCSEDDPACLVKTINETKTSLYGIVEELRRISNDLMPASLDELGLETALKNLCNDVSRQTGLEAEFFSNIVNMPVGNNAVYLFRIAQEAIQNIIKHSKARYFSVQFIGTRDFQILIIEDNGTGFNPESARKGNGLINMRERAGLLGGTVSVESDTGKGTTIRVKIPCDNVTNH